MKLKNFNHKFLEKLMNHFFYSRLIIALVVYNHVFEKLKQNKQNLKES